MVSSGSSWVFIGPYASLFIPMSFYEFLWVLIRRYGF